MAKVNSGCWGIDLRNAGKTSAFEKSSNAPLSDGPLGSGRRSRGGKLLLAEERAGSQQPETHDRWPGWFRVSFIVGATGLLWGLIFHIL
jgi:hypothetical protein